MAPRASLSPNGAHASVRYLKVSPYKVRQVLTLIRGLPVDDARRTLQLCPKDAADHVMKVLDAAVANAEHNLGLDAASLVIASATADMGPSMKRYRPRAQGRAYAIKKQTCHISIAVAPSA